MLGRKGKDQNVHGHEHPSAPNTTPRGHYETNCGQRKGKDVAAVKGPELGDEFFHFGRRLEKATLGAERTTTSGKRKTNGGQGQCTADPEEDASQRWVATKMRARIMLVPHALKGE